MLLDVDEPTLFYDIFTQSIFGAMTHLTPVE